MDTTRPLCSQEIHSFLLWMPNWIGDVVLTLPVIQSLRRAYPVARISVVVKSPSDELLLGHPAINTVLTLPSGSENGFWQKVKFARNLKKFNFDVGVVFPNSFGSAFLLSLTGVKCRLGYTTDGRDILLTHPVKTTSRLKKEQYRVEYFFKILSSLKLDIPDREFSPLIQQEGDITTREVLLDMGLDEDEEFLTLHPGTSKVERGWHAERFGILCQKLIKEDGMRLVLLGTEKESQLLNRIKNSSQAGAIKIIPPVNLRVLTGLLRKSRLFIGNDSGMMHLAAMVGIPVLGIFGPGSPATTGPYMAMEKQELVTKNFSCSPCRQRFFKECQPSPLNKPYCLEDITVKDVHEAVRRMLKRY
ncbi:MAG: lipopolysaccharide heptosyltransferase II [Nitrospina sp.]|nr:lipopolysaccharide heptosyltransferase II [Nitrospina sp.]MBT3855930.1 lipopolysaccharide heptosyltransferase II [Nitrospina sp.]MBT4105976.1 lipopolysaccharide heptosyltransferase II [Nitrospina sp.]MBT4389556.1 lipopolysaccharide heptosyltransferase II [Nitrospina sp.]MBT4619597.1 lipopolysaccharide heptosyltransferase II [Nitrospina sp.]